MLQTSLLLMKSLNKTETPIFLSVVCSLFPKAIFLTFISPDCPKKIPHISSNASSVVTIQKVNNALANSEKDHRKACQPNYSRTSTVRTSLGSWKFVRDMGSSSH